MKYDLTFLEAVKALEEGKCSQIENTAGCKYEIRFCALSYICDNESSSPGVALSAQSFLGKWRLVDPEPVKRKEVIEGVTWHRETEIRVTYPTAYPGQKWSNFLDKPLMKMTLEWEE